MFVSVWCGLLCLSFRLFLASHSTTSFSESALVMVEGTSYQMLEVLAFCNRERAQPPSITITVITFLVKKSTMNIIPGCLFFEKKKI